MFMYELDATDLAADPVVKTLTSTLYTNDEAGLALCQRQQCIKKECELCEESYNDAQVFSAPYVSMSNCHNLVCGSAETAKKTCLACEDGGHALNFTRIYDDAASCESNECNQCRWCPMIDAGTSDAAMWSAAEAADTADCQAAFCASCGGCKENWYNQLKPGSVTVYFTTQQQCTDAYCIAREITGDFQSGACDECTTAYATYFYDFVYEDTASCQAIHCDRCDENVETDVHDNDDYNVVANQEANQTAAIAAYCTEDHTDGCSTCSTFSDVWGLDSEYDSFEACKTDLCTLTCANCETNFATAFPVVYADVDACVAVWCDSCSECTDNYALVPSSGAAFTSADVCETEWCDKCSECYYYYDDADFFKTPYTSIDQCYNERCTNSARDCREGFDQIPKAVNWKHATSYPTAYADVDACLAVETVKCSSCEEGYFSWETMPDLRTAFYDQISGIPKIVYINEY